MFSRLGRLFASADRRLRQRLIVMYLFLVGANVAAWTWAVLSFRHSPVLLGTAFLAYSFGLRHAVDADHIAAIDSVTRKLMQQGETPTSVGLFFSLGHAVMLIIGTLIIGLATSNIQSRVEVFNSAAGLISTAISAAFLLIMAIMNIAIAVGVYRTFRRVRAGGTYSESDLNVLIQSGGLLSRIFRPLFRLVTKSWHMAVIGFLFGLGFDTITEVGLMTITATEAGRGVSVLSLLVFPFLFAAGMTLIDATDGVLMLGAYGWAFVKPIRKLYYNLTITTLSAAVALIVGGLETLGLITEQLRLKGPFWDLISTLNENWGTLGYLIIALFALSWVASAIFYRLKGFENLEISLVE